MKYIKRRQTVSYAPGYWKEKPMIRIINSFLLDSGFQIGNKVEISYESGRIVITRMPFQFGSEDGSGSHLTVQKS